MKLMMCDADVVSLVGIMINDLVMIVIVAIVTRNVDAVIIIISG